MEVEEKEEENVKMSEHRDSQQFSKDALKLQMLKGAKVTINVWTSGCNINRKGSDVGHVSIKAPEFYLSFWPESDVDRICEDGCVRARNEGNIFKKWKILYNTAKDSGLAPIKALQKFTYQEDCDAEGRGPEYSFDFYTLDIDSMKEKYEETCKTNSRWSISGLTVFGGGESCASSAWKLLIAGGVGKLVPNLQQSSLSLTQAANGFLSSIKQSMVGSYFWVSARQEQARNYSNLAISDSLYSSEMIVSLSVKSPDFIGELLKKAKHNESKNNSLTKKLDEHKEPNIQTRCDTVLSCFSNYRKPVLLASAGLIALAVGSSMMRV